MAKGDYYWAKYSEKKLLSLPFQELKLQLQDAPFSEWIAKYEEELHSHNLRFRPHLWIADDWFSPDEAPGIAIPFYLCHPRLKSLQRKFLYATEGGKRDEFLRIIRHEAGHAFDNAYQLFKRKSYRKIFGNPNKPYPTTSYIPNPHSDRYVQNIRFWYAQTHPREDFAETFAVCLRTDQNWRRRYRKTPKVLRKLEYVEELFHEIGKKKPKFLSRKQIEPISRNPMTLGEYFRAEREKYELDDECYTDGTLRRLFTIEPSPGALRATTFLKKNRSTLRRLVGRWTNVSPLLVDYIVEDLIVGAQEMKLYLRNSSHETLLDTLCVLSHEVALLGTKEGRIRIPF